MYIKETHSTNALLREILRRENLPEGFVVRTDFQTAGKGQVGNSWESEAGKNLLFSMVLFPWHIDITEQFIVSQMISLAIVKALSRFSTGFTIKWPNDIYYGDKKIAGILIENSLQNGKIKSMVIGVGLNVNQKTFLSNAPNPVSLRQVTKKHHSRKPILEDICKNMSVLYHSSDFEKIRREYMSVLYRNDGFYPFRAEGEVFDARISDIATDGRMHLELRNGELREFYFKEVEYLVG